MSEIIRLNQILEKFRQNGIVTASLVSIFSILFVASHFFGGPESDLLLWGALDPFKVWQGEYYRLITCIFLHYGWLHIFFNGYATLALGRSLEPLIGWFRFLLVFFVSGLSGSLVSLLFSKGISVGASGSIFGLIGTGIAIEYFATGLKSRRFLTLAFINLLIGFMIPYIDNAAHIGGCIGGLIVTFFLLNKIRPRFSVKVIRFSAFVCTTGYLFLTIIAIRPEFHAEKILGRIVYEIDRKDFSLETDSLATTMRGFSGLYASSALSGTYYFYLGKLLIKQGDIEGAIKSLETGLFANSKSQDLYDMLYKIYLSMGDLARLNQLLHLAKSNNIKIKDFPTTRRKL